jgi:TonB family protein
VGAAVSSPAKAEPKAGIAAGQPVGSGSQASAGTAAAPAREPQPAVSSEDRTRIIPEPESAVEKVVDSAGGSSISPAVEQTSAPAPGFTFGGNVGEAKAADGKSKKMLLAVAAVVLVAAAGYEGWTQWKISGGAETGETRVAVQRAVVTPAPAPLTAPSAATTKPSFDPSSLASAPAPSSIPSSAAAAPPAGSSATVSDTELPASAASAEPRPNKAGSAADSSKAPLSVVAANKAPATAAAAQPIIIKNGLSRPSAKTAAPASEDAVPSMTGIAAAGDGGALSNLMGGASKAPTPVLQTMSISQGVSRGLLVKTVQPSYPSNALRMHIEGPVELLATISRNGDISTVKILKGDANLAHAAADAVKQWKYKPYLLNGEPVDIQTEVTVIFKLPR